MNTKIYYSLYTLFVAGALLASGCSNDDDTYDFYAAHPDAVRFHITAGDMPQTRVNTESDGSSFESADLIAISADGGTSYSNYILRNEWLPAEGQPYLRWKEETLSFQAYYPVTPGTDYTHFTVPTNQSDESNLRAADYMTASAADQSSERPVELTFKHQLAKVTITSITLGEELKDKTIDQVTFHTKGHVLENGRITNGNEDVRFYSLHVRNSNSYMAILPPQSGNSSAAFIKVLLNNTNYPLTGIPALEAGKAYTLALQVGHDGVKLASPITVENWGNQVDMDKGTAIFDPTIWDGKYPTSVDEALAWMEEPTTSAAEATPATYTITTAKQLAGMAYYCATAIRTETFELATDIDLAEHPWRPVGVSEDGGYTYGFEGIFNGHGHTIKGMNVTGRSSFGGFIAFCRGTVKNLIVEGKVNPSINNSTADLSCGGIVGEALGIYGKGNIIACGFRGTIVGSATSAKNAFSGGIAGYNEGGNITGCISWATSVTATGGSTNNCVGGIVGFFKKYTNSQSHSTIQPTAKGNRWYYNGTGLEGIQELSGGTETNVAPVTENNAFFANNSAIDANALSVINSYLADNDYIWQKAVNGKLELVERQP